MSKLFASFCSSVSSASDQFLFKGFLMAVSETF